VKSFARTFFVAGITSGIICCLYFGFIKGFSLVWSALIGGTIAGLATAILTRFRQDKVTESEPVLHDETMLREGRATYESMSGRLYLTDRRILFVGYPTDDTAPEISRLFEGEAPAHEISIPILLIADVIASRPLGIDSRLDLTLTDGSTKRFGTEDLAEWIDEISTARQMYLDRPKSEDMKLFP